MTTIQAQRPSTTQARPFTVSVDCHVKEPPDLWEQRIDNRFRHRLPHIEQRDGKDYMVVEGHKTQRVIEFKLEGIDLERSMAGSREPAQRMADLARDGVDAEVTFPQRGLSVFASPDAEFQMAQAVVYNDWLYESFHTIFDRMMPAPMVPTRDVPAAIREVERVAKLGFRTLFFPAAVPGQPYNLAVYDPLWATVQDAGLPISFHIATGRDPRTASGAGGAIFNYAALKFGDEGAQACLAHLLGSGVCDRFPRLKFGTIEAMIGWIPWLLHALDEAQEKHHMWSFPKLSMKPSEFYQRHCFASFQDDPIGLTFVAGFEDQFMWSNDYPHHEGTWPYSAEVIAATMAHLTDTQRRKILGLNAARIFGFEVPADRR
jgi:predicted TIM-barrel fold metal-dependent hydrolase